jgi:serine/threonine protein kinase
MSRCPSRDQLEGFLAETLAPGELEGLGKHVESCRRCQHILDSLMRDPFPDTEILSRIKSNPPPLPRSLRSPPRPIVFPSPPTERGLLGRLGSYHIVEKLGEGSFGVVYKAYDEKLDRWVAVKVLRPELAVQERVRRRFENEARAAAAVKDPNVVIVHAVVEAAEDFPQPFLVMEFVEGESLRARMTRLRPCQREAAWLIRQVALGLSAAHRRGVIHRDVKPDNILLETPGNDVRAKIADFGIAQAVEAVRGRVPSGSIVGTIPYMSPEAFQPSDAADARSDLFSLGVTLYELLTGELPFRKRDPLTGDAPPVTLPPKIPPDLSAIARKCLAADPERRYQTAYGLAEHLDLWLENRPVPLRRHGWSELLWLWYRRRPDAALLVIGLALAVLVGGVSLAAWRSAERANAQRLQADRLLLETDERDARKEKEQGNYQRASVILAKTAQTYQAVPDLVAERARVRAEWEVLRNLSLRFEDFVRFANESWSAAGEERGVGACVDLCERALANFGIKEEPRTWWSHAPAKLLTDAHRRDVQAEAHRLLLLLAAMRIQEGLLGYQKARPNNTELKAAAARALEALAAARALEQAGRVPPSRTAVLLEKGASKLPDLPANKYVLKARIEFNPARVGDRTAVAGLDGETDLFFHGVLHVFLAKHRNDDVAKALKLLGPGDFDFRTPSESAERLLRRAIQLGGSHYWNHFMLGRILLSNLDFKGAELAFIGCVQCDPNYSRGYEQRGLALSHQAAAAPASSLRQEIRERMDADLRRALQLSPQDPSTYWVRGHALKLFPDRREQALEAYSRALELEHNLQERVSRRNQLADIQKYTAEVLQSDPSNARALALRDRAMRALRRLDEKPAAAEKSLP